MNNLLKQIQESLTNKELELIYVDSKQMQEINLEQRNIDKTTDVLSFPLMNIVGLPLGSIVINTELAKQSAKEYGHKVDDEIALMFIHGLLHLLGYDHEIDDGQMRKEEEKLIKNFNLPKSLILRSE